MKLRMVIAVGVFVATAATSFGAVTVSQRPNLSTEIQRGFLAVAQCGSARKLAFYGCVLNLARAEELRHSDYKPFEAGLFLNASIVLNADLDREMKGAATKTSSASELSQDTDLFLNMYVLFREARKELGLADKDFIEIAFAERDWPAKFEQLHKVEQTWAALPKPPPVP
jgi:hypothetical protein